jgi:uncharacterized protein
MKEDLQGNEKIRRKMWYSRAAGVITIQVYVQPGAKSTEIAGFHDGSLKIRLNVPPIKGRGNIALQEFLAKLFHVSPKQVKLLRGEKSRRKTIQIMGSTIDPEQLSDVKT